MACPLLIPQTTITTAFDRSALDQVEELGGKGTPVAGHLKCKRHESLDGRISSVCIGEAFPTFSSSTSTTTLCRRMTAGHQRFGGLEWGVGSGGRGASDILQEG